MGRCSENVFRKITSKNIKSNSSYEIDFAVLDDLPSCKPVMVKYPIGMVEDATAYFDRDIIPENIFECKRLGCVNTGTLQVTMASGKTNCGAEYHANYDATEWVGGLITMYANITEDTTLKVTLSNDNTYTNTDAYTFSLKVADADADGFVPVVVDLLKDGTVAGTGWQASTSGAYIKVESNKSFGLSSIMLYDEAADFETNDVVKVGCVQSIEGNNTVDVLEKQCAAAQYSNDINGIEITLSGNSVTANYWKLNPRLKSVSDYIGSMNVTDEKVAVAETIDGTDYAVIVVPDAYNDECTFYAAQIGGEGCSVTEDTLVRNNLPVVVDLDIKHYQVLKLENGVKFVFNKKYVDKSMIISYPQMVEVERQVATKDAVGERRVMARYARTTSDGEKYIYTYPNLFVTSFPENVNNSDESTFEFTINAQPDSNGRYYTRDRVIG